MSDPMTKSVLDEWVEALEDVVAACRGTLNASPKFGPSPDMIERWAESLGATLSAMRAARDTAARRTWIRPESVWADGTARTWWIDDGDGPKATGPEDPLWHLRPEAP